MNVIDTNIWLYAHDSRDPFKRRKALELIENTPSLALPWQVGCEFIAASRKLKGSGFTERDAWLSLHAICSFVEKIILPQPEWWKYCEGIQQRYQLGFWDAMIVVACIEYKVEALFSEDFSHQQRIENVVILNPFAA